jgi:cytochrome c-type biogenesis protein CcmI
MPEWALLLIGLAIAGSLVLSPLLRRATESEEAMRDDADLIRHRSALEALRDVEADRRAGSLDDSAYAAALGEAEARARETRAALDAPQRAASTATDTRGRRWALLAAATIGVITLSASLVPATGVANEVVDTRRERIADLTDALVADPTNPDILLSLADAYLEGTTTADLSTAVRILQVLLQQDPANAGAYERVVAAYVRAGDWSNARAALDDYARIEDANPVEVAFLDGLIALQGENDAEAAVAAFDRFLQLAPDDPRAYMISSLREEAAADEDGG